MVCTEFGSLTDSLGKTLYCLHIELYSNCNNIATNKLTQHCIWIALITKHCVLVFVLVSCHCFVVWMWSPVLCWSLFLIMLVFHHQALISVFTLFRSYCFQVSDYGLSLNYSSLILPGCFDPSAYDSWICSKRISFLGSHVTNCFLKDLRGSFNSIQFN